MKYFNIKYDTKNESIECNNDIYNINLNINLNEYNITLLENLLSKNTINYIYYKGNFNDLKFLELIYPIKTVNDPITQSSNLNKL